MPEPVPEPDDSPRSTDEKPRIDVEEIARLVYQLMLNDLMIARERGS